MVQDKNAIIKELRKENEDLKEQVIQFNTKLYSIHLSVWEGGSGSGHDMVLCKSLKDAVLIKEALKKIIPDGFGSSCGDEEIRRQVKIEIQGAFVHDVKNFVEKEQW